MGGGSGLGRGGAAAALVLVVALGSACGASGTATPGATTTGGPTRVAPAGHSRSTVASASPTPTASHASSTPKLDSMVVMGHSGTTGADSDPSRPGQDAPDNSWATGDNPKVDSIYLRLLRTHPALKGHNNNLGESGSMVDALLDQTKAMLQLDPLPDLVIIQTIDNDIHCDGTDAANYAPFADTVDKVVTQINTEDANAQIFFIGQWGSVQHYADAIRPIKSAVAENSGTGLCDLLTPTGQLRPQAVSYLEGVYGNYYQRIVEVCARHRNCYTDRAALERMTLSAADLAPDHNHLSVHGLQRMAALAWAALPAAIRNRA